MTSHTQPTRYTIGDKVVITESCLEIMRNAGNSAVTPDCPTRDFMAKARVHKGAVGKVTHTFPPGYEVTAQFNNMSFHMKDNWIEKA